MVQRNTLIINSCPNQRDTMTNIFTNCKVALVTSLLVASNLLLACSGKAAPAHFYPHQLVDHLSSDVDNDNNQGQQWSQRYYEWKDHFQGPGSPIFLILGGEGHISPETGIFYPFISDKLAKDFGAFVVQPEHRFYGFSQPLAQQQSLVDEESVSPKLRNRKLNTNEAYSTADEEDPRVKLFTSEQALMDAVRLVQHVAQDQLHCSPDKSSPEYCPVIAVGGSYPGFLSAMARLRFPNVIDISYAASAPMRFYSQEVHEGDYYNHITKIAEKTIPGCSKAVQDTLNAVYQDHVDSNYIPILEVGICPGTLPSYVQNRGTFFDELIMMVGYSFANDNMANYPPTNQTRLYKSCEIFLEEEISAAERLKKFLVARLGRPSSAGCFSMMDQLPTGPNATITGGDWSGDGTGADSESWDFQTCTLLVEKIGFSQESMFPARNWTIDWMTEHCQARFGVTPRPRELVDSWQFNDLVGMNASRILFTNGLNDGWSVGAVKQDLSASLLVLNFENGAHHSDLNHWGPMDTDTADLRKGHADIQTILSKWLDEVKQLGK